MQRIMIVGGAGSGKSTLARVLGRKLGLPVFHMDQIHWQKNWVERPLEEKMPLALAVEARDAWVFEGGMSATYQSRMARADVLVWLDLPVTLRFWRVTKRLFTYLGKSRPDLPEGCVERIHPETAHFYWFIWTSRVSSRAKIKQIVSQKHDGLTVAHLRTPRDVRTWLTRLV